MEFQPLNEDKKDELEPRHRYERDSRVCDRIRAAILLKQITPDNAGRIPTSPCRVGLSQYIPLRKFKTTTLNYSIYSCKRGFSLIERGTTGSAISNSVLINPNFVS